ncbi:peptidylprolyl isomerase [Brevifollis gellanilyticus]|uniref:Peptidylprolyl isomerase n=1 Tax=Brevifollis gellanilyticus TaxID=748831 RepID=A0A512MD82_9BACT|nr:peptidylprolyl isomerase [Brevifollis gellanilyticus]GEP44331.1 peptidylprolyl isomerase [Brevifollis gellanilyticus]
MMKHLHPLLMLVFAGLSLADEPLGRLGSIELTADDLRASIQSLSEGQIASLRADPALLEQIARTSLVQKLILQEATEKKWPEQPHIAARVERARQSVITESYLESIAEPPKDYPSESEVKSAYEASRESLRVPQSFRLAQIFIAEAPGASQKLAKAQELLAGKDADFAKIAADHSQEPTSASRGGEIGWLTETQIEAALLPQVSDLKLFAVSGPVKLKDGWHILKLLDARAPHTPTLEQARPQIVKQLRQEKLRTNSQAYLASLLRQHALELNTSALTQALPREPAPDSRP